MVVVAVGEAVLCSSGCECTLAVLVVEVDEVVVVVVVDEVVVVL